MISRMISLTIALAGLALSGLAHAGTFHTNCEAELNDCGKTVVDIVTDKFISRFPADKWELTIIADVMTFPDGGRIAHAVVGVTPRGKNEAPVNRELAAIYLAPGKIKSVQDALVEVIRNGVSELMDDCDHSKTCDVYTKPQ